MTSIYQWQKKLVKEKEVLLLLKTTHRNIKRLTALIEEHHSYTVPCLVQIDNCSVNKSYYNWMLETMATNH